MQSNAPTSESGKAKIPLIDVRYEGSSLHMAMPGLIS